MLPQTPQLIAAALLAGAALAQASAVSAATLYADRAAFEADTAPTGAIDFEDLPDGSSFSGQELSVGPMRFSGGVTPGNETWNVISPVGFCEGYHSIDGSRHACVGVSDHAQVRLDFLTDVSAWGADFSDMGDQGRETALKFYDDADQLLFEYVAADQGELEKTFIGVDFEGESASYMTFSLFARLPSQDLDGFGMDNVIFTSVRDPGAPAPVPLPPAALLLGSAAGGLMSLGRLRRKRQAAA
ncbi:hypothetical protein [Dinoroseobacter sp. S375]|uniref:hypothetical protein n=1 Tax=Dinoroseobacter sp. S375 TaxID=3415136 RepID=UPI003C7E0E92